VAVADAVVRQPLDLRQRVESLQQRLGDDGD
jgi:hypothetical protein